MVPGGAGVGHHFSGGGDLHLSTHHRDLMTLRGTGPRRRASDHVHPEYWEESQQHRYEDKIGAELNGIKHEVKTLSDRILLVMGGVGLLAFVLPLIAPFIRGLFGIP